MKIGLSGSLKENRNSMPPTLAEIIAAKKAPKESILEDDCFLLSDPTGTSDASLRAFLHLVHIGNSKANLLANDHQGLRLLAEWLAPFPFSHLPYNDSMPKLLQSYTMWQIGAVTKIPPAKFWPVMWEVMIESDQLNRR